MSKAITAQIQADYDKIKLPGDYFNCTAHQAPECTGRGFLVGRALSTCSPCLNWQKRQEAVEPKEPERYAYWFLLEG